MKRAISFLLVIMLLLTCLPPVSITALAADVVESGTCGENLTWTLDDAGTLTISGTGAMTNYSSEIDAPWYRNRSNIKSVVIGFGVTSIGDNAFRAYDITSITIPYSVTGIGNYAFEDCENLAEVIIPTSVTSIGNNAFKDCDNLAEVTIPTSVTSIGNYAFYSCGDLASVTIGNGVTSIGNDAFGDCDNLAEVIIPNSVTSIGNYAFSGCNSLTGIWVSENNFNYSSDASGVLFNKAKTELLQVPAGITGTYTVPNGVTGIGSYAFYNCYLLKEVTIPDGVTAIGGLAFGACGMLKTIILPDSVTAIGGSAFRDCGSLKTISLPDSVTSLGYGVFMGCTALTDVHYGGTAEQWANVTIGTANDPLLNATIHTVEPELTGIAIKSQPNKTQYCVGESLDITGLTLTATYSDGSTKEITEGFDFGGYDCATAGEQIITVTYEGFSATFTITVIYRGTCGDNLTWTLDDAGTLTISGTGAMYDANDLLMWLGDPDSITRVVIEPGVTTIGADVFTGCRKMIDVIIPNSVTSIGDFAFISCRGLTSVTIPNSVTNIGTCAFYDCTALTDVHYDGTAAQWAEITIGTDNDPLLNATIHTAEPAGPEIIENGTCGENLTWTLDSEGTLTISGTGAMYDYYYDDNSPTYSSHPWKNVAESIEKVVIANGVTSIGEDAFRGCSSLTSITIPDSVTSIGDYAFSGCSNLTSITIPDSVTSIDFGAFSGCSSLTAITLPDSVTSIGWCAFEDCSSLTSIIIPDSVTSIDYSAFSGCSSLTAITIPDGVTSIGGYAFSHCSNLTAITIPDSVTSIGWSAFYRCSSLKSITIPDSVTSIGSYVFEECTSLTAITIPDSVTSIGDGAFSGCESLTDVTIPDGVTSIGDGAFDRCYNLTDVYYSGTQAQWDAISIGNYNTNLTNAHIHFVESTAAKIGDTAYASIESAIEAAVLGDTIFLTADVQTNNVILPHGVTLDLNGCTLTVDAFTGYAEELADGYIIDSSAGNTGLLVVEKEKATFKSNNPDMPLYDAENGGYRFFDYKLTLHSKPTNVDTGKEKFWFKFHFYTDATCTELDSDAYGIVAAGGSGMEVRTALTWKGKELPKVLYAKDGSADTFVKDWADDATAARWLYVIVSGLDKVGDGTLLVAPEITANGVEITKGNIKYINSDKPYSGETGWSDDGPSSLKK